jgi:putative resolvase
LGDNDGEQQLSQKAKICYARVSSEHQRKDLDRQIADLRQRFPGHEILSDVGSGLNWKRRAFTTLLERVHAGAVEEIVVTRKDRLCRFGSELVEWIFEKNGTRLVVLGSDIGADSGEAGELAEDLLAIVTVFVARHNGLRSAANRRKRRETAQKEKENREPRD